MTGEQVKDVFYNLRVNVSQLARKLDIPSQNIFSVYKSLDVKSGMLEKIAEALGKDMSLWYPELKAGNRVLTKEEDNPSSSLSLDPYQIQELQRLQKENEELHNQCARLTEIISNLTRKPNPFN